MNAKVKIVNIILILNFSAIIILGIYSYSFYEYSNINYIKVFTLLNLIALIPFIVISPRLVFSPSRIFSLSVLVFILARPIINLFSDVELVEVGFGINNQNIASVLLFLSISLSASSFAFMVANFSEVKFLRNKLTLRFDLLKYFVKLFKVFFIFFGILFLVDSYYKSITIINNNNYFDSINNPDLHSGMIYFFIAKLFCTLSLITTPSQDNFKKYSFLITLFSLGFIALGLRGYFIAYFFLFLYFYNEYKPIKFYYLILLALFLLFGSSYILEYRLNYNVYNNYFEMITKPLYQQGATFEVFFGSIVFSDELSSCLSITDYFLKIKSFGSCVDIVRGVPFIDGGFASSFYAESYYLGWIFFLISSFMVGIAIKFLNFICSLRLTRDINNPSYGAAIILYLVVPNLVYFGRASAFDFLLKLFLSLALLKILYLFKDFRNDNSYS